MWDQALLLLEAAHVLVRACTSPMFRYKLVHELFKGLCKITFEICKILTRRQAGHISMVSLPQMNLKNQEMFCFSFPLNQWKRKIFFLMLHLWVIRSADSTSDISLSYRRADTSQGRQHWHSPWYGQQSCPLASAWVRFSFESQFHHCWINKSLLMGHVQASNTLGIMLMILYVLSALRSGA